MLRQKAEEFLAFHRPHSLGAITTRINNQKKLVKSNQSINQSMTIYMINDIEERHHGRSGIARGRQV